MTQEEMQWNEWENPANWGGPDWMAIYFSKRDSRVLVPKRRPWMGWTLNLARGEGLYWLVGLLAGIPTLTALIAILIAAGPGHGGSISAAAFPRVIVKTVPSAGDNHVDPGLREVRVTFARTC